MAETIGEFFSEILSDISSPTIVIFVIAVAIFTILGMNFLIPYLYQVLNIAYFAYPVSRCMAKQASLIKGEKLKSLVDSQDTQEVVNNLEGTEYVDLQQKYLKKTDIDYFLNCNLAETYSSLYTMAPEHVKDVFHTLKYQIDVFNLKNIFLAQKNQSKNIQLIEDGNLYQMIDELKETEGAELFSKLNNTPFYNLSNIYESNKYDITRLDYMMQKTLYSKIWALLRSLSNEDSKAIKHFVATKSEIYNINLVIRKIIDNKTKDDLKEFILPFGYDIAPWKVENMLELTNLDEVVGELKTTFYGKYLQKALDEYQKNENIHQFELSLMRAYEKAAHNISMTYHLWIGPMIGYIMLKEIEMNNLRTIFVSKDLMLNSDDIYKYLVIPN